VALTGTDTEEAFAGFVRVAEPRLSRVLVAAYGHEVGREVTRDALAYAWEHWPSVSGLENPLGYLYRVAQSRSRWYLRRRVVFSEVDPGELPRVEPRLPLALSRLSQNQRIAVVLIHVEDMTERDAGALMGLSRATVRRHAQRGMDKLRKELEVDYVD
jgi:RNA polymerase sigma factor (sigma-70 family)